MASVAQPVPPHSPNCCMVGWKCHCFDETPEPLPVITEEQEARCWSLTSQGPVEQAKAREWVRIHATR